MAFAAFAIGNGYGATAKVPHVVVPGVNDFRIIAHLSIDIADDRLGDNDLTHNRLSLIAIFEQVSHLTFQWIGMALGLIAKSPGA